MSGKFKFDSKAFLQLKETNPKKFWGIVGGVVGVLALSSMFMDEGGSSGDPYGGGAVVATAPVASGNQGGIMFDDMGANENQAPSIDSNAPELVAMDDMDTLENQEPALVTPGAASAPMSKKPIKQKVDAEKPNQTQERLALIQKQQLQKFIPAQAANTGDEGVDELISRVDGLVKTVIASYDLSAIKGDALKGTTTQEELMRRTNAVLDMLTDFQKKRLLLIEATQHVKVAKQNPAKVVEVQVQPIKNDIAALKQKINGLESMLASVKTQVTEAERNKGVAVANAQNSLVQQQSDAEKSMPKLSLLMGSNDGMKANLKLNGTLYAVTRVGQRIGDWKVEDLNESYVVVTSDITKKHYMLTMSGGSKEVRIKGEHKQ